MSAPRYEREIRSILNNLPDFPGEKRPGDPPRRRVPHTSHPHWSVPVPSARDAFLVAIVLVVLAQFGRVVVGVSATHLLGVVASLLIIYAIAISLVRAFLAPTPPHVWRGQIIESQKRGGLDDVVQRVKRWLRIR
ncbi:MAG: hypothetical protein M1118_00735 [Chloroflexi bacterium]|nr:hypothetical protein [Chloroflexota bacterium]